MRKMLLALLPLIAIAAVTSPLRAEPAGFRTLASGDAAPDFKLPGVDGREYSLDSFKDAKLLAIVFTCNHCPTAQAYEERIIKLHADYKEDRKSVV